MLKGFIDLLAFLIDHLQLNPWKYDNIIKLASNCYWLGSNETCPYWYWQLADIGFDVKRTEIVLVPEKRVNCIKSL